MDRHDETTFTWVAAGLAALMLAALTAVAVGLLARFVPGWNGVPLVATAALIALEAAFVAHVWHRERADMIDTARHLLIEALVLVIVMRVAASYTWPAAALGDDLRRWLQAPLSFFDPYMLSLLAPAALIAFVAYTTASDIILLGPQSFDGPPATDDSGQRYRVLAQAERQGALNRIATRFVGGGMLLLLAIGVQTIAPPLPPGMSVLHGAPWAVMYTLAGFVLYSQARLALLHTRWRNDGAQVERRLGRTWTSASMVQIGLVVLGALLLPRSYGLGLLDTLRAALGLVGYIAGVLVYAVIWVLGLLAIIPVLLINLLPIPRASTAPPPAPLPFTPPPVPATPGEPPLWPSLIFWLCMIMLSGYTLWLFLQRHPGLLTAIINSVPLRWLLRQLRLLWSGLTGWSQAAARVIRSRQAEARLVRAGGERVRLHGLPPREVLRYLYRSTLARAALAGLGRRRSQTPYEYERQLAEQLPDASADIADLTAAYVDAAYAPGEVDASTVRRARGPWARLRRRLSRGDG